MTKFKKEMLILVNYIYCLAMDPFSMLDRLQLESVNKLHVTIILTIVVCVKMVWNSE